MADNTDTETPETAYSPLSPAQYGQLLRPIDPTRVRELKGNSYVEAWDIRRQLTRIFGFGGWDLETISLDLVRELEGTSKSGGTCWTVIYRAQVRLTVKNTDGETIARYEDCSAGDAKNQPSLGDAHDLAMKSALSGALKRAAMNLGDQFGLSLYNKGDYNATIRGTLAPPPFPEVPAPVETLPPVDAVIGGELDETETIEPERRDPQPPAQRTATERPASAPAPATDARPAPEPTAAPAAPPLTPVQVESLVADVFCLGEDPTSTPPPLTDAQIVNLVLARLTTDAARTMPVHLTGELARILDYTIRDLGRDAPTDLRGVLLAAHAYTAKYGYQPALGYYDPTITPETATVSA